MNVLDEIQYQISQVKWKWYDVVNGLRAVRYWFPVIWKWRNWDWSPSLEVIIHTFRGLEEAVRTGYHVNGEKDAKNIRILIRHLERIRDRDVDGIISMEKMDRRDRYDWERVSTLLRKHLRTWWD